MQIMPGTLASLEACLTIATAVALRPGTYGTRGFLLGHPDAAAYVHGLRERVLWVCQEEEAIVGFVLAYPSTHVLYHEFAQRRARITWDDPAAVPTEPLIYIDKVATHPRHQGRGIARLLYQHLFGEFPRWSFIAGIAERPIANLASMAFHERLGFRRVGTFRAEVFAGVQGYASGIYCKAPDIAPPSPTHQN
jgi:ribosomal protein S18 acetylase RimI-like enzyme